MDFEPDITYPRMAYSDSEDYDDASRPEKPMVQLPLSPISNSPPRNPLDQSAGFFDDSNEDSAIPSFLPPFPITVLDAENDEKAKEKEEELKREAELQKQKEAEEQEKEKVENGVVVQTFPANYIVPAPYEVSKLQARGTWHLPSISVAATEEDDIVSSPLKTANPSQPPPKPFIRGTSTAEELLSALQSLNPPSTSTDANNTPSTFNPNAISTNPLRHKVSLVFLGTTPMRYNTPDTLFGLSAGLGPTPRPPNPLPTHVVPLDPQPGIPTKGKNKEPDLVVPPAQGRSVGTAPNVINAVTGTSSRIPTVGRRLLAVCIHLCLFVDHEADLLLQKPTLLRTKRLMPPPPQKRDERLLLYHAPDPPLPAIWNIAVSGSNSQYAGTIATQGDGKGKPERNPFGVVEANMAYTWDWNAKVPWEAIDRVKGASALPPGTETTASIATMSVDGGIAKEKSVPKIHVNFPGRRSSTLSSITPASGSGLIARLPGLSERSPSHSSVPSQSSMGPPPALAVLQDSSTRGSPPIAPKINGNRRPKLEMQSPTVLEGDAALDLPFNITMLPESKKEAISAPKNSSANGNDLDIDAEILGVAGDNKDSKDDVDDEIANVLGDTKGDVNFDDDADGDADADDDIDAVLGDAIGSGNSLPTSQKHSSLSIPPPVIKSRPAPDLDLDVDDLLEKTAAAIPAENPEPTSNGHDMDIDILGVGEPPNPPGEGSAYLLTEMDYLPGSDAGRLEFASSTTLPLPTSSLRDSSIPLSRTSASYSSGHQAQPAPNGSAATKEDNQFLDSLDDELVALTGDLDDKPTIPRTTSV